MAVCLPSQIGVKKVGGGSVTDSFLVKGVAFKKTFSYAGFEQQPKSFDNPGVLLLNVELELKSEKVGGVFRFSVRLRAFEHARLGLIFCSEYSCAISFTKHLGSPT